MESMSGRIEQTMSRHQKRQSLRQSDVPAWPNAVPTNAWVKRLVIRLLFQIISANRLESLLYAMVSNKSDVFCLV